MAQKFIFPLVEKDCFAVAFHEVSARANAGAGEAKTTLLLRGNLNIDVEHYISGFRLHLTRIQRFLFQVRLISSVFSDTIPGDTHKKNRLN